MLPLRVQRCFLNRPKAAKRPSIASWTTMLPPSGCTGRSRAHRARSMVRAAQRLWRRSRRTSNGLKSAIDSLPLASESGLGQWAADLFESSLSALGLEPVDLSPQKATLINTAHIMSQDDSNFSLRLLSIKEEVLSAADTDSLFTDAISSAEKFHNRCDRFS